VKRRKEEEEGREGWLSFLFRFHVLTDADNPSTDAPI